MKKQPYCRFPLAVHANNCASNILIPLTIGALLGLGVMLIIISL